MHVTETGPALRRLGQSFPTQRSGPGANTRAPTLPPHVITDWEYGKIEYGGLPVEDRMLHQKNNGMSPSHHSLGGLNSTRFNFARGSKWMTKGRVTCRRPSPT
jgi:hypothetical protein